MIVQLVRNFRIGKLLCEARDITCMNCAARRVESPFVAADIPLDPGILMAGEWSGLLRQGKFHPMEESYASQSLSNHSVVQPTLLPALCGPGHRVEENQAVYQHLRN